MKISFSAIDRMIEEQGRSDPDFRAEMERQKRPVLSQTRELPTEELVRRLEPYTGPLAEEGFRRLCSRFPSAEEMARSFLDDRPPEEGFDEDMVWLALVVLWERWAPEEPSFESLDARMQLGYEAAGAVAGCEIWLGVWRDVLRLADRFGLDTVEELDERFGGTQCLFNWVQDFELELANAGVEDETFRRERIRYCEEFLTRFPDGDQYLIEGFRRALAESHFAVGAEETGERLYREWLEADPTWGWGWIGWSDAYWLLAGVRGAERDYGRAETILSDALSVPDLRDREYVLERLADVYGDAGRTEDEARVRRELKEERSRGARRASVEPGVLGLSARQTLDFGEPGLPLDRLPEIQAALRGRGSGRSSPKVGRNEPCPCGSGKKYKKCCLRAG
jgi:hypothetical protein